MAESTPECTSMRAWSPKEDHQILKLIKQAEALEAAALKAERVAAVDAMPDGPEKEDASFYATNPSNAVAVPQDPMISISKAALAMELAPEFDRSMADIMTRAGHIQRSFIDTCIPPVVVPIANEIAELQQEVNRQRVEIQTLYQLVENNLINREARPDKCSTDQSSLEHKYEQLHLNYDLLTKRCSNTFHAAVAAQAAAEDAATAAEHAEYHAAVVKNSKCKHSLQLLKKKHDNIVIPKPRKKKPKKFPFSLPPASSIVIPKPREKTAKKPPGAEASDAKVLLDVAAVEQALNE